MLPRAALLVVAVALAGCTYPGYVSGTAPSYPSGYQPVMGGYATDWPAQPGAMWGPEDVPNIEVFRDPLSPHGRWLQSPQWGVVFVPNAPRGWRPYQNGQWLENRFWLSGDPWGWATDHYGRWGYDEAVGWVWVPDTRWGPSWVAWREADDVVGWAPIPPRVTWNVGIGFGSGWGYDNWNSWYGPSWVWVPRSSFYTRGFGGRILPWNSGLNWWGRSRWQHTPYWGWNRPWDRSWGWRTPYGGGNWGNRGWNGGRGWNGNRGWNGGRDWNDGRDWDRSWRQPRRGEPGSIGDRIGRDMTGQPPRGNPGWGDGRRGGGNWQGRAQAGGAAPPPQYQQPQYRPQARPDGGDRPMYRPENRGPEGRGDRGQRMNNMGQRSSDEGNERPQ